MANDCTFTITKGEGNEKQTTVIDFIGWDGPFRPDLMPVYEEADQDGTKGAERYIVDNKPREFNATVFGTPDSDRSFATSGSAELRDGINSKLHDSRGKKGTLKFYDGETVKNVRLLDSVYIEPMGVGTSTGIPIYERVETLWVIEG